MVVDARALEAVGACAELPELSEGGPRYPVFGRLFGRADALGPSQWRGAGHLVAVSIQCDGDRVRLPLSSRPWLGRRLAKS